MTTKTKVLRVDSKQADIVRLIKRKFHLNSDGLALDLILSSGGCKKDEAEGAVVNRVGDLISQRLSQ